MSSQDKAGTVYFSATGNLWLVLEDSEEALCLHLESGRVQRMSRSMEKLALYGWREWEEWRRP